MHNHKHKSKTGNSCTGACLQEKLAGPRGLDPVRACLPSGEASQWGLPPVLGGARRFHRRDFLLYDMHMQEFSCTRACTQRYKAWLKVERKLHKGHIHLDKVLTFFNFIKQGGRFEVEVDFDGDCVHI